MTYTMFIYTGLTGIGATLLMDLWSLLQKYGLGIPPLNYGLVGRWIHWFGKGKFRHNPITATPAIPGEALLGWGLHYLTGVLFAFIPWLLVGSSWLAKPTLTLGLLTGLITLFAPFIILQPALGFGVAASRTGRPWLARLLSLVTHAVYGCGLYVTAIILRHFFA